MTKKWLTWLNLSVMGISVVLIVLAMIFLLIKPSEITFTHNNNNKRVVPQGSFTFPKAHYDSIGKGPFELKFSPLTMQVPDLRNHLNYYGKNGRPDANVDNPVLHFGFTGSSQIIPIQTNARLYLLYDKLRNPPQYIFSPENRETALWIEAMCQGNEAKIKVSLKNETGEIVQEPLSHSQITLQEKESARIAGKSWDIGKWRVDGGLLARQKARWLGPDLFLERHGGEEYKSVQGKHRLDFTDDEETYSVFVGIGDSLVWKDDRWKTIQSGEDTLGYPLMVIKKIDERVMNFEFWDIGGKNKMILNLIRMHEPWVNQDLQESFNFLGARTRSQYIFEVEGNRMLISPKDWLLQTGEGWIKLSKSKDIDNYVDHKLTGNLFVFDGIEKIGGRQVLKGVSFNITRTEMKELEIPLQKSENARPLEGSEKDDDEDDDDREDEPLLHRIQTAKELIK